MLRTSMNQRARAIATRRVGCVGRDVRAHEAVAHCRVCPCVSVRVPPPDPRTREEKEKRQDLQTQDASFRMVAGHRRCRKSHGMHIASCSEFVRGSVPLFVAAGPFGPSPWRAAGG